MLNGTSGALFFLALGGRPRGLIVVAGVLGAGTLLLEDMIGEDLVILIGSTSDSEDAASSRESNDDRRDLYVMRGFRIARRRGVGLARNCVEASSSEEMLAERERESLSFPTIMSMAGGRSSLSSGDPSPSSNAASSSGAWCCCCLPFRGVGAGAVFLGVFLLAGFGVIGTTAFFFGFPGARFTGVSETAMVSSISESRGERVRDVGEAMRTRFEEGAVSESGVLRLGGIGGACEGEGGEVECDGGGRR